MLTRAATADAPRRLSQGRERIVLVALLGALAAVAVLSLGMGPVSIPPGAVLAILASQSSPSGTLRPS